jgi:transcriptional regulator with XRE-family HTH domain
VKYSSLFPVSPTLRQFGRKLKALRQARGLSQAALGKRADLTREYINKLEAGQYDPTLGALQRIAKALGVKVTALVE